MQRPRTTFGAKVLPQAHPVGYIMVSWPSTGSSPIEKSRAWRALWISRRAVAQAELLQRQMIDASRQHTPLSPGKARTLERWLLKTLLFLGLALLVLNPNLKRAALQVRHTLHPESLIDTRFPALAQINEQIDRWVAADHGRRSEPRLIAKFVIRQIRYVSDYDNWSNLEYWPTAPEVWERRQEDCDGRAILATSILRSRGFTSAHLVIGLDHMWVRVDENECDPAKRPNFIALLNPNADFSLELGDSPSGSDFVRIARAVIHPTAFRATSTHLLAEIPTLRKAILVLALIFLCLHPCKHSLALISLSALGLAGVALIAEWQPGNGYSAEVTTGGVLLLTALAGAVCVRHVLQSRGSEEALVPESRLCA